ncbi:hypothetical protein AVEN_233419-1 [Araneus ventricosus]|uniref:Uncharacterized protein n=1 Tax=Araneus ventricosus TaxID=182803 RepID=A0A4Y2SJ99_ARAVE|nr:hypothetical protein AVEN_233419-1 [Araneus ventricosus]
MSHAAQELTYDFPPEILWLNLQSTRLAGYILKNDAGDYYQSFHFSRRQKEKQQRLAPRRPNGPPGVRRCYHLFSLCQAILIQITQRKTLPVRDAKP